MENYNLNVKHVLICHNYFLSFCGYLTKKTSNWHFRFIGAPLACR